MKYCTSVELKREESFTSHVFLNIVEKPDADNCQGWAISLIGKGLFAGMTQTGFLSTVNPSEAVVFRSSQDAQKVVNIVGLYPQPGIHKFDYAVQLVEGWQRQKAGL